jgi:hypothetical protein
MDVSTSLLKHGFSNPKTCVFGFPTLMLSLSRLSTDFPTDAEEVYDQK